MISEETPKGPGRGGKREGAGRKVSIGPTEPRSVTLRPDDIDYLLQIDRNLSAAIRKLIERDQRTPRRTKKPK